MAEDKGFVARWARLKRAAREKQPLPSDVQEEHAPEAGPSPERCAVEPAGEARPPEPKLEDLPFDPASLPDLESLTYESDYSAFMQKGVPIELRNQALRRLWRSSPVLANLDGLVEYGEDYSGIGTKKMLVRTAYRVGRGMIDRALEQTERQADAAEDDAPHEQERIEAGDEAGPAPVGRAAEAGRGGAEAGRAEARAATPRRAKG